jgi:NAD(P)-dependent dehydrogenase (short-subunit alcohol dehydrogenase family)
MPSYKNYFNSIFNFKNKTALVTGAGGYLGRRISFVLGELNCNLILVDHPSTKINYNNKKISVKKYYCNFESSLELKNLIKNIKLNNKTIDIVINNASFTGGSNVKDWIVDFKNQNIEIWENAIKVGLTAAFEISKGLAPNLKRSRGNIINIGSIYSVLSPNKNNYVGTDISSPAAYSVLKSGLLQLTKWLAVHLGPDIRVNMISPGGIYRRQNKIFLKKYLNKVSLNRMCKENDIDGALVYLASDFSSYVTGHNLLIDGGYSIC